MSSVTAATCANGTRVPCPACASRGVRTCCTHSVFCGHCLLRASRPCHPAPVRVGEGCVRAPRAVCSRGRTRCKPACASRTGVHAPRGLRAAWRRGRAAPARHGCLQTGWTCLTRAERTKRSGQVLHVGLDARQVQKSLRARTVRGGGAAGSPFPVPHPHPGADVLAAAAAPSQLRRGKVRKVGCSTPAAWESQTEQGRVKLAPRGGEGPWKKKKKEDGKKEERIEESKWRRGTERNGKYR